jgi:PAS domain S-box-containing protein
MPNNGERFMSAPQGQEQEPSSSHISFTAHDSSRSLEEQIALLTEERLRLVYAQRAGGIGTFDWDIPNNHIIWTPELEMLYGLTPGGFEGRYENWAQRVHPEDLERTEENLAQAIRGETPYDAEFRVIWPDESIHWLLAKGDIHCDDEGRARRVIGVNIDITARKLAEQELARQTLLLQDAHHSLQHLNANLEMIVHQRTEKLMETADTLSQLNTELERSNQELLDFAHVASHDLQEPLRKIQAFGNLLEEEHGDVLGDGKAYLDRMRNAASRMQILINDLLAFARVTTRAQPFSLVDLNSIAQEVIDDLETRVKSTGGQIECGQLPEIEADALQMHQMFLNLLSNALKFHRNDVPPRVTISAERVDETGEIISPDGSYCRIRVQDNGIGFDEKYLDRIFTVFQRLHRKNEYEGTGIGLAVVRKIAERHNGAVTATSTPDEGATFIITLPVMQTTKDRTSYDG